MVLLVRTAYSFGEGVLKPEEAVKTAAEAGYRYLLLGDVNSIAAAHRFLTAAEAAGVKPLPGATIRHRHIHLLTIVENPTGYANLCELLWLVAEGSLTCDDITRLQDGLVLVALNEETEDALKARVNRGRFYCALLRNAAGRTACRPHHGTPPLALVDVRYSGRRGWIVLAALEAIHSRATLEGVLDEWRRTKRGEFLTRCWLPKQKRMKELFADAPEALRNAAEVAERCSFSPPVLPRRLRRVPDAARKLRRLATCGARKRYGQLTHTVRQRLQRELALIEEMGFADYFLLMREIVRIARRLGSPAVGRGSGASSIVAYCLGITDVDPLKWNLPFERFLNRLRPDPPDLDVDFDWRLRDSIIEAVMARFGSSYVGRVSTHITFARPLAVREAARILGATATQQSALLQCVQANIAPSPRRIDLEPPQLRRILRLAHRIEGLPHHLAVHIGGLVVADEPIWRTMPLQKAPDGQPLCQHDKDGCEAFGLVKLDLLGSRALGILNEAASHLPSGSIPPPDEADTAVVETLAHADTLGCVQLESPAMRGLLAAIKPRNVFELARVLALIRPGAASLGAKRSFIRRHLGLEKTPSIHPKLDRILAENYGFLVFEDDIIVVLRELFGLSGDEADALRRRIVKAASPSAKRAVADEFMQHARRISLQPQKAASLLMQMAKFNQYSFCRAHAASYARLAWSLAWLKTHHPLPFWCAVLNNIAGMYPRWLYVEEAKRAGIRILAPCVQRSGVGFSVERDAIRVGLAAVKGISATLVARILAERQKAPFAGIADFLRRCRPTLPEARSLILAGACDCFGAPRPHLLLIAHLHCRSGTCPPVSSSLPDFPDDRKWLDEWRLLGFSLREHPAEFWRRRVELPDGITPAAELAHRAGQKVRVFGLVVAARQYNPRERGLSGRDILFLTLSDPTGLIDCHLPAHKNLFSLNTALLIEGIPVSDGATVYLHATGAVCVSCPPSPQNT